MKLRTFRCFEALRVELGPTNFFIGRNGEGKTSILEAACVLLRLQSQRSSTLAPLIRIGQQRFTIGGRYAQHELEFRYSTLRRKLIFDAVEQSTTSEYLRLARVVSFANTDIELVRGASDARRRFLDFLGAQVDPLYRPTLRAYERALRARNALLKSPQPRPREIAAYVPPLLEHGAKLSAMRAEVVRQLAPFAAAAHDAISGVKEQLTVEFTPGNEPDFAAHLAQSAAQEARLRQTVVGPHRDDLTLLINEKAAAQFASEGQQRTAVLALKTAQARVLSRDAAPPLLLVDDIFGELDPERRNRLLRSLPADAQKLVTATTKSWIEEASDARQFTVSQGNVTLAQ
ncbi:MAG: DNA replication and repair protein RecF [Verrucomicrobiota bacterium]|nr:DNA replication and repair protein RecF [Verrucomicrobiota bacterium]